MCNIKVKSPKHSLVRWYKCSSKISTLTAFQLSFSVSDAQVAIPLDPDPIFSCFSSSKLKPSESLTGFSRIIQACVTQRLSSFLKASTTNFGPFKFRVLHGFESRKGKDFSKEATFTGRDAQQPVCLMEITLKSMTTCLP